MIEVKVRRLTDEAMVPTRATEEAAGFDLYLSEAVMVHKGSTVLCKTGIAIELPPGYEGQVRSRSGLSENGFVVANSPGTLDSDYRGEVGVLIHNQGKFGRIFRVGDRIAQLVIKEVPKVDMENTGMINVKVRRKKNEKNNSK